MEAKKRPSNPLTRLRLRLGLTQAQLAGLIGLGRCHYTQIEIGRVAPFSLRAGWSPAARKIAAFFELPLASIFPNAAVADPKLPESPAGPSLSCYTEAQTLSPERLMELRWLLEAKQQATQTALQQTSGRNRQIWRDRRNGRKLQRIADHHGITKQRVDQLLQKIEAEIDQELQRALDEPEPAEDPNEVVYSSTVRIVGRIRTWRGKPAQHNAHVRAYDARGKSRLQSNQWWDQICRALQT